RFPPARERRAEGADCGAFFGPHPMNVVPAKAGTSVRRAAKKYFMAATHKRSHLKKTDLAARSF
ncbi:hypothetical protein, partial [Massilia aurea]|uniref:hypothetical protein n=1 Tax=Massilia aurea TaxID=373040 RepID=UPI001C839D2A